MKFLADECVDQQIVEHLRRDGNNVQYIPEMKHGISDDEVFDLANQKDMILLTCDKDFGELVFRQGRITQGIVLIRLAGLSQKTKGELVTSAINVHQEELRGAFTVITTSSVRIRQKIR